MGAWKRWQDWVTVLLGVILLSAPFVFDTTAHATASWTAYLMGGLVIAVGLFAASFEAPLAEVEGIPLYVGIALFAAPWVLSFTSVREIAWMAWIVATLLAVNAALELLLLPGQSTTA